MSEKTSRKITTIPRLQTYIINTLTYFDEYSYPPTVDELRRYLQVKINSIELNMVLQHLITLKRVVMSGSSVGLSEQSILSHKKHDLVSKVHMAQIKKYAGIFKFIPWIKLVGVSGSLSLMDSSENDDIDLFIITSPGRIWTTRMFLLIFKHFFRIFRFPYARKLCFNLFFTEDHMEVPISKRGIYNAHEVLQMKPIISSDKCYERFLMLNNWVTKIFPNVHINSKGVDTRISPLGKSKAPSQIDNLLQKIQIYWLKRKKITFSLCEGQAWLLLDSQKGKSKN